MNDNLYLSDNGSAEAEEEDYEEPPLTYEEIQSRKDDALAQLKRLEQQGYSGSRKFSFTSKLEEIEDMVCKLTDQRNLDNGIAFQRKCLTGACYGIEFLNKAYPIFDIHLDGWSEAVFENMSQYDDVFEELYYKYRDTISMAPELKLLGMVTGSAVMFHFSRASVEKAGSQVPGFEQVMKSDPELRRKYQEVAAKIVTSAPSAPTNNSGLGMLSSMFGGFTGNPGLGNMVNNVMNGMRQPSQQQSQQQQQQQPQSPQQQYRPQQPRQPPQQPHRPLQKPQTQYQRPNITRQDQEHTNEPTRRTRRAPMTAPESIDVDGLLAACDNTVVQEVDLSAIDNLSDLSE
jgi:hypothetical protein